MDVYSESLEMGLAAKVLLLSYNNTTAPVAVSEYAMMEAV
jgi:hypothetical protein